MRVLCHRRAWLTLDDGSSIELEDQDAGYACSELNLGWPDIRDVVNNRPDQDGTIDETQFFGARVVSANLVAVASWGTRTIDDIARSFGPYLVPSVRPMLHWIMDTPEDDYLERTLVLRAQGYSSPIVGNDQRSIALTWVAPDAIAYDATLRRAIVWADATRQGGRKYPLIYDDEAGNERDRRYPVMTGGGELGSMYSNGDVPVWPIIRMYGPGDDPIFTAMSSAGSQIFVQIALNAHLSQGQYVEVDLLRRSATLYTPGLATTNAMAQINWHLTQMGAIPPRQTVLLSYRANNPDYTSQAVVMWRDGVVA